MQGGHRLPSSGASGCIMVLLYMAHVGSMSFGLNRGTCGGATLEVSEVSYPGF